jgi:hypothetical protein
MGRLVFVNSTRLNENKYTIGSGVGSINNSNRAAIKRRATNSCCINNVKILTRYIKVYFPESTAGTIQISQIAAYSKGINVAPNGTTVVANTLGDGDYKNKPIDGVLSVRDFPNIYHSYEDAVGVYWLLDLGREFVLDRIVYYNSNSYNIRSVGMLIDTYDKTYNNSLPNASLALKRFTLTNNLIQTFNL